jgi:hypothetical protein
LLLGVRETVLSVDFAAFEAGYLSHFGPIAVDFLSATFLAIVLGIVPLK